MIEIRDNLIARITEARAGGSLGEVEGLQISLAGAEDILTQLDQRASVDLGLPTFTQIAGRSGTTASAVSGDHPLAQPGEK